MYKDITFFTILLLKQANALSAKCVHGRKRWYITMKMPWAVCVLVLRGMQAQEYISYSVKVFFFISEA